MTTATNPTVDPVRARQERKAKRRKEQEFNKTFHTLKGETKIGLKSKKRVTQARIRATTPFIEVIDLVNNRRDALRGIEESTDNVLVALRRRLVFSEKLLASRTRERDSANRAHKAKCQALTQSQAAFKQKLEESKKVKSLLLKRIIDLEETVSKHQKLAIISTNGTKPQVQTN